MTYIHRKTPILVALALALSALPALAEKPAHAGGGKNDKWEQKGGGKPSRGGGDDGPRAVQRSDGDRSNLSVNIQIGGYFNDSQRRVALDYYEPQFRAGNCPPGLAKKNNGCLPPGQAKQWIVGQPLPRDLVRYPLPVELRRQLGRAPAGYEYVRVDNDILMLIIGTGMVMAGPPPWDAAEGESEHSAAYVASGSYEDDEDKGGEEEEGVLAEIHETAANLLYILILLHIAGVIFETRRSGRQVLVAMAPLGR